MAKTVYLTVCFLLKKRVFSQVGSIVYLACRWCGRIPGDRAAHPETESPRQILFYLSGCKLLILPFLFVSFKTNNINTVQPRQTFSLPRNVFYFFAFLFLRKGSSLSDISVEQSWLTGEGERVRAPIPFFLYKSLFRYFFYNGYGFRQYRYCISFQILKCSVNFSNLTSVSRMSSVSEKSVLSVSSSAPVLSWSPEEERRR